ncbi:MAG: DUF4159 domain-containing protein, partial [Myxococcales bacterium]|nr:DUF4159 domain-containing protein [Myxococcales bacterium]
GGGLALLVPGVMVPSRADAFGRSAAFGVGRIVYDGAWDLRPTALSRMLQAVEQRTSILTDSALPETRADSEALFDTPFVVFTGDREFDPLPDEARQNLQLYLRAGGTILFDSSEEDADGPFRQSVERELAAILPGVPFSRIGSGHVLYRSFYLIDSPPGRTNTASYMEGCEQDGRLLAIYSHNDLLGALARDNFGNWIYEVRPGGERQREMSFRMGINLAMYVLCLDYKEDQTHVRFLLHQRSWRVDPSGLP